MTDKERYATIGTWVEVFREEGVRINDLTIRRRLELAKAIAETARNKTGRLIRNGFYAESDVRKACADFLLVMPCVDERGFIEKNGERYATAETWAEEHSFPAIKTRLRSANFQTLTAKARGNAICVFYAESDILDLIGDYLENPPCVGEDGFLWKDGERYGTTKKWTSVFDVSEPTLINRITTNSLVSIKGRTVQGNLRLFFAESDIRKIIPEFLDELPKTDAKGFLEKDGERYATIGKWSELSQTNIKHKMGGCAHQIPFFKGRNHIGVPCRLYAEPVIRSFFNEFPPDLPECGKNGFFEKEGESYASVNTWAKVLEIANASIVKRLDKHGISGILGKPPRGGSCTLYSETVVREVCADLIAKKFKKER